MDFRTHQLANGLQIVAEINPAVQSMAAGFFVRTGSRDETPDVAGVSHFLEHMVFKGTDRRSALDVNLEFDRLGANYNAFTSEEMTVYYGSVLPEFQGAVLDLLCDILRPSLRESDFDMEKQVILDEIALYEDQPHFRVYDKLMSTHFAGHALGNDILGSPESITALQAGQMRAYFDRRYSPTNLTLIAVGRLDFDALVASVESLCGAWNAFEAGRDLAPAPGSREQLCLRDEKLVRQNLGLMVSAPSAQDDERYAAQLLARVLGDAGGSWLHYALVETAIADEAHCAYNPMDGAGVMMTYVSCDPDAAQRALDVVRETCETFLREGCSPEELQAAKNKIATSATLHGELPMGRLVAVGADWLYRRAYQPLAEQIEQLFAVSGEEVMGLAASLRLAEPTLVSLGPRDGLHR